MSEGTFNYSNNGATEQQIVEHLLNIAHQENLNKAELFLAFTALGEKWHYEKLMHYYSLIWEARQNE